MYDNPRQHHDDVDQQYFALPSPVATERKTNRGFPWSLFVPSHQQGILDEKQRRSDGHLSLLTSRDISDTLLPTTYAVKGDSVNGSNFGNLHQRNVGLNTGHAIKDKRSRFINHRDSDTTGTYSGDTHKSLSGKTCNSFLLGGQYYPGKDKKRRSMRRTLWYRICCSTLPRKILSWLVVSYALYSFVSSQSRFNLPTWLRYSSIAFPIFHFLSRPDSQDKTRDGKGHATNVLDRLQYDTSLQLLSIREEEVAIYHIESERSRLQFGSKSIQSNVKGQGRSSNEPVNARQKILEQLAPQWFHRYDGKPHHSNVEEMKNEFRAPRIKKKKNRSKAFTPLEDQNRNPEQVDTKRVSKILSDNIEKRVDHSAPSRPRVLQRIESVSGGSYGEISLRTIHNMHSVAANSSSCKNVQNGDKKSNLVVTTLVTQTSVSRLWILKETCDRWNDPIVAVVFVPHGQNKEERSRLADLEVELLESPSCSMLSIVHYLADQDESAFGNYPVNRLRNVGLDRVTTTHVLVMDVDFVPSIGLDQLIRKVLKVQTNLRKFHNEPLVEKVALIVPAFERKPPDDCGTESECAAYLQRNSSFLPHTFSDLQGCVESGDCIVFQNDMNPAGHSTTQSKKWLKQKWNDDVNNTSILTSIPCFHTARYEPYVVLEWCAASANVGNGDMPLSPYYDERFHGYGKNKIEMISHLRKSGYSFQIIPEGFIVHNPHPESSVKEVWNDINNSDLHSSMDILYGKFMKELETMYADQHQKSVKLCQL